MAAATPGEVADWPTPNSKKPENLHSLVIGLTIPTFTLVVLCEYFDLKIHSMVACITPIMFTTARLYIYSKACLFPLIFWVLLTLAHTISVASSIY